jgi:hypothetical protein
MADLAKQLEDLHAAVVETVKTRIENGGTRDDDGNLLEPLSNDDLRVALQLLKQNAITANLSESDTASLRSRMAGKLDFSALQGKVVPIARQDDAATA